MNQINHTASIKTTIHATTTENRRKAIYIEASVINKQISTSNKWQIQNYELAKTDAGAPALIKILKLQTSSNSKCWECDKQSILS